MSFASATLLTLTDASLAFGHVALLDHAELSVASGERIALIGRNGAGKSSLLRVLAGAAALDAGERAVRSGLRIEYVAQEPDFGSTRTVFEAVADGLGEARQWVLDYESTLAALHHAAPDAQAALGERLHQLEAEITAADAWSLTQRVESVLSRLALDGEAELSSLSGGTAKRVALARALVASPDLLMLDEPTNHLDIDAIRWLEDLMLAFEGAIIVITHDRSFLDRVATRVVELDRGRLRSYPGRFSDYQRLKADELNAESLANARFDKLLAQEEVWIRKGVEARRTRNEGRVKRLEQLRRERSERRDQLGKVRFELDRGERSGKVVAELVGVGKCFDTPEGEHWVVRDFSAIIQRGARVGLIGRNGAGKSTLLRLILGELTPDAGSIRQGTQIEIAYFDQMREQLDPERSLADTISPGSDWIEIGGQRKHVMSYLGDFLFSPERARSPVRSLSGGERNRLLLARLFARPANVLVLDEPTNDLDIETLELLESLLLEYNGTVFLVSHDRTFLDNLVTQTIAAEGGGVWREYVGGYEDWLRQRPDACDGAAAPGARSLAPVAANRSAPTDVAPAGAPSPAVDEGGRRGERKTQKLGYREQRELETLPADIEALEAEQRSLQARLDDPAFYVGPAIDVEQATRRFAEIEELLLEKLMRWEALEARR